MKLKEYLELNGITYEEAAKKIGVTKAAICQYVLEQTQPRLDVAVRIVKWSEGQVKISDLVIYQ